MKTTPAISCVIPVFNGKRDLQRAVGSVLAQRPDVEVVLVDDGSTDGSGEHVLQLARDDRRVVALLLPESRGQGNARNIGVAAANSSYVTFLDQDDEHIPGWYDYAVEFLDNNAGHAAIKGGVELMDVPADLTIEPADPRLPAIGNSVMWNVVLRKVVYQALGGCPTSRHYGEDVAFMSVLNRHSPPVATDYPSTQHYVRPSGSTARFLRRTRVVGTRFEFLETHSVEVNGTLAKALQDFEAQADINVRALHALLKTAQGE